MRGLTHSALSLDGLTLDGLTLDGPTLDGPTLDGPTLDGPTLDGPTLELLLPWVLIAGVRSKSSFLLEYQLQVKNVVKQRSHKNKQGKRCRHGKNLKEL